MEFYSAYAQGFARVAACTIPVALADPAANAATVLAQVRECHDEGVAVAVFPELCLSGYSIDDLLLQDTLLTAVQDAIATLVAGSADLLPVIVVGAPLMHGTRRAQLRGRDQGRPDPRASRRSPTCRTTASSTSAATSHPATTSGVRRSASPATRCRSAPT